MDVRLGTWRRVGSALLSVLVLVGLGAELSALGSLGARLLDNILTGNDADLLRAVITCIAVAASGLLLVMTYIIAAHRFSEAREQAHLDAVEIWTKRWVDALFGGAEVPEGRVPRAGREALIRLVGNLEGIEFVRAGALLERHGVVDALLEQFASRRLHRRLEAVELLSVARPARAFASLIAAINDQRPEVRVRAARGGARILGTMPPGPGRDRCGEIFARRLSDAELSSVVFEEMLLLCEGAATVPVSLLVHSRRSELAVAAFNTAGRLKMRFLHNRALMGTGHHDPEIRAASFRCLSRLGPVGPAGSQLIRRGFKDPASFVRVNAARAATCAVEDEVLPGLWMLLGDQSWWVRRAAAEGLAEIGSCGRIRLLDAVVDHSDRFARDVALQVAKSRRLYVSPLRLPAAV